MNFDADRKKKWKNTIKRIVNQRKRRSKCRKIFEQQLGTNSIVR